MYTFNTTDYGTQDAWLMVLISSIACILGASVVFIDALYPSSHCSSVLERPAVIASSMALGSGVMLFSALYTLLPASRIRLQSDYALYFFYFIGIVATLVITQLVHYFAPDAIHSHGPDDEMGHHHHHHHHGATTHSTVHPHQKHHPTQEHSQSQQVQKHMKQKPHHRFSETSTTSSVTITTKTMEEEQDEDVFFKSTPVAASPTTSLNTQNPGERTGLLMQWGDEYGSRGHHHHATTVIEEEEEKQNDYFRIGIQTAIAICIHKFPEGLIMFISGQASERLGLSVCAAMTIHNIIEGFMIALPLYFATQSRVRAFFYAAFLGGMSQPFGAALGVVALDTVTQEQQDLLFGITFGVVSGMMSLISIQSMLPQAIKADPKQRYVPMFFFVGILLVGLASLLKSI
ncbi:Zinc/iron permease [Phascolomyces articulosus]|uniref:Zinc/iron permease n=1 Tax=Phascolomyces articulosus TaxID=60185 RepID=A0AAD5PFR7_9FUNG|nr:Zinc/iron permease [Phascolomyces articulosus]